MSKSMRAAVGSLALLFLFRFDAHAWNEVGHMTVAELAWQSLSDAQRATAAKTLSSLPGKDQLLADRPRPDGVSESEWLFLVASTWPDWLHSASQDLQKSYDRRHWHYVNFPLVIDSSGHVVVPAGAPIIPAGDNVIDALNGVCAIVGGQDGIPAAAIKLDGTPAEQQAAALCWMLHLAGDIHQPLHCATMFSKDFPAPKGDEGGNLWWVALGHFKTKLHSFWDEADGFVKMPQGPWSQDSAAQVLAKVKANITVLGGSGFSRDTYAAELARTSVKDWAAESQALAVKHAYALNGAAIDVATNRDDAKQLPDGYKANALKVANRQIALAGYRLTDLLAKSFPAK